MAKARALDWLQPAVATGSVAPFVIIVYRAFTGTLGANPITTALNQLGLLALIFLVASLLCSPLKVALGWKWPLKLRKTLGLAAFWAALLHFLVYLFFDQVLMIDAVIEDIAKRPFILFGFLGLCALTPLALTSTKDALKRMGFVRWKRLHRLAYVALALGVLHFAIRVKKDLTEPLIYAAIAAVLLAIRLVDYRRKKTKRSKASVA